MRVAGISPDMIAKCIGISIHTLMKHFPEELELGRAKIHTRIADSLIRQAMAGNTSAMIFYAKTQMGWREGSGADKARLAAAQADVAELELQKLRGELVSTSAVRNAWAVTFTTIRDLLRSIPIAVVDDVMASVEDGRPVVKEVLQRAIDDALARAARIEVVIQEPAQIEDASDD